MPTTAITHLSNRQRGHTETQHSASQLVCDNVVAVEIQSQDYQTKKSSMNTHFYSYIFNLRITEIKSTIKQKIFYEETTENLCNK
jgi:hypothetical protein